MSRSRDPAATPARIFHRNGGFVSPMKSVLMGSASSLTRPREKQGGKRYDGRKEGKREKETGDSFVRFFTTRS